MEKISFEELLRQKARAGLGVVILDSDLALSMATFMEYMRTRLREAERGSATTDLEILIDALHQTENSICKQLRASSAEIAFEIRQLMYKQGGQTGKDPIDEVRMER